jgi:hypothetical protein
MACIFQIIMQFNLIFFINLLFNKVKDDEIRLLVIEKILFIR